MIPTAPASVELLVRRPPPYARQQFDSFPGKQRHPAESRRRPCLTASGDLRSTPELTPRADRLRSTGAERDRLRAGDSSRASHSHRQTATPTLTEGTEVVVQVATQNDSPPPLFEASPRGTSGWQAADRTGRRVLMQRRDAPTHEPIAQRPNRLHSPAKTQRRAEAPQRAEGPPDHESEEGAGANPLLRAHSSSS